MDTSGRHFVLVGEYELTLDEKKRLLVPAEVRRAIPAEYGEAFFLVMGINRVPWFWPARYYEEVVMNTPSDMSPGEDLLAFDHYVCGMSSRVEWDKQGRIVLPEKMLRRTVLEKDVTLVGARDHLELWTRPAWEERREELEKRAHEVYLRAKAARANPAHQPAAF